MFNTTITVKKIMLIDYHVADETQKLNLILKSLQGLEAALLKQGEDIRTYSPKFPMIGITSAQRPQYDPKLGNYQSESESEDDDDDDDGINDESTAPMELDEIGLLDDSG